MCKRFDGVVPSLGLAVVLSVPLNAQDPTLEAMHLYGGSSNQTSLGIAVVPGEVYLSGHQDGPLALILKVDGSDGSVIWWGTPSTSPGFPYSIVTGLDGTFVAGSVYPPECGAIDGYGSTEGKTCFGRFDTLTGIRDVCQTHLYYPGYRGWEEYYGLAQRITAAGPVYYAAGGAEEYGWGRHRYLVAGYDPSGVRLGYMTDSSTYSVASDVAVDAAAVYLAGFRRNSGSHYDPELPFVVKVETDLDGEIWRQTLDAAATGGRARFLGVAVSGDAVYAVGQWMLSGGNEQYVAARLDSATGDLVWQKVFGGPGFDILRRVAVHEGRVFAIGVTSSSGSGGWDAVLLELDSDNGDVLFEDVQGGALDESHTGIAIDGNDLWVAGWAESFATPEGNDVGERDIMLLHYSLLAYVFGEFLPPVEPDGSSIFNSGRVIPLKFTLYMPDGESASGAVATLAVSKISSQILGTEMIDLASAGQSNTGNLFRFDADCGCFIYNLSTKGFSTGTYAAIVSLDDGSTHELQFSLR